MRRNPLDSARYGKIANLSSRLCQMLMLERSVRRAGKKSEKAWTGGMKAVETFVLPGVWEVAARMSELLEEWRPPRGEGLPRGTYLHQAITAWGEAGKMDRARELLPELMKLDEVGAREAAKWLAKKERERRREVR